MAYATPDPKKVAADERRKRESFRLQREEAIKREQIALAYKQHKTGQEAYAEWEEADFFASLRKP